MWGVSPHQSAFADSFPTPRGSLLLEEKVGFAQQNPDEVSERQIHSSLKKEIMEVNMKRITAILTAAVLTLSVNVNAAEASGGKAYDMDFGLPEQFNKIEASTTFEDFEKRRAELPEEIKQVQPAKVEGKTKIFIATDGDDTNPGTLEAPVATIEKAVELAKAVPDKEKGIVIYFRGGTHRVDKKIILDKTFSGSEENPIFFSSYNDEEVWLTNGYQLDFSKFKPVSDFEILDKLPYEAQDNLLEASFDDLGLSDEDVVFGYYFRPKMLYNGVAMNYARYPNGSATLQNDVSYIDDGMQGGTVDEDLTEWVKTHDINQGFTYTETDSTVLSWTLSNNIEVRGWFAHDWLRTRNKVDVIDPVNKTVKTKFPVTFYGRMAKAKYKKAQPYYENVLESADVPGDFVIDTVRRKIYIYPYNDEKNPTIEYRCLRMEDGNDTGTWPAYVKQCDASFILDGCENVTFNGLGFRGMPTTAINIIEGFKCVVQNCNFNNVAKSVQFDGGRYCGMIFCNTFETEAGALSVYETKDRGNFTPQRIFVQNNVFSTPGASTYFNSNGSIFSHNVLLNSPSHTLYLEKTKECIVEYNEICAGSMVEFDAGMIYVSGFESENHLYGNMGNHIRYNYIHYSPAGRGVYFDDRGYYNSAYGNIMEELASTAQGVYLHSASYETVYNNIIKDSNIAVSANYYAQYLGKDLLASPLTEPKPLLTPGSDYYNWYWSNDTLQNRFPLLDEWRKMNLKDNEERLEPTYSGRGETQMWFMATKDNVFKNNYIGGTYTPASVGDITARGEVSGNVEKAEDPLFDSTTMKLAEDSPVYKAIPGFEKINSEIIGPSYETSLMPEQTLTILYPTNEAVLEPGEITVVFNTLFGTARYKVTLACDEKMTKVLSEEVGTSNAVKINISDPNMTYYLKVEPIRDVKTIEIPYVECPIIKIHTTD